MKINNPGANLDPICAPKRTAFSFEYRSLLLPGIFLLGAFLRFYDFWVPELWIDEYGTWWAIAPQSWNETIQRIISYTGHSPFYYSIVKIITEIRGIDEVSLRLPSVVCGVGIVVLSYPLGLKMFGDKHAALLTSTVFAINEKMIWYSQEARPYALALFFLMLSFYFFLSLLEKKGALHQIGYIISTLAAFYTHYFFGVIALVQLLYLFLVSGKKSISRNWLVSFGLILLFSVPGLFQLGILFGRRSELAFLSPAPLTVESIIMLLEPVIFSAAAVSVLLVGFSDIDTDQEQFRKSRVLLTLWFIVPILSFGIIPSFFGFSLLHIRYIISLYVAVLFIYARLLASTNRKGIGKWIPIVVFVALTFTMNLIPAVRKSGTFSPRPHEGWAKAAALIGSNSGTDDLILLRTGLVEADLLSRAQQDPSIVSLSNWPLIANFTSRDRYEIFGLPYRMNAQTKPYTSNVLSQAEMRRRVWIVGTGEILSPIAQFFSDRGFRSSNDSVFGNIHVILVER